MATLEMVPLRSKLPTGLMTLRHQAPVVNDRRAFDVLVEGLLDEQSSLAPRDTATTPKVDGEGQTPAAETAVRKGRQAR
jgi:hypothetical protein